MKAKYFMAVPQLFTQNDLVTSSTEKNREKNREKVLNYSH